MNARETAADAGQVGAEPFTLAGQVVALEALRLVHIEEDGAAPIGIARPGQGGQGQLFVLGAGAGAAKAQVELHRNGPGGDLYEDAGPPLAEPGAEPVGIEAETLGSMA